MAPATVEAWLNKSAAPANLGQLAGQQLTHRALGELGGGKTAEHLRAVLVAMGTLPARDEQTSRLERPADRPAFRPLTEQTSSRRRRTDQHSLA